MVRFVVVICFSAVALAQTSLPPVALRITDLSANNYTCSVLTLDGRVRREIVSVFRGLVGSTQVFEGNATDEEIAAAKAVTDDPATLEATRGERVALVMAEPGGRIVAIEFETGGVMKSAVFVSASKKQPIPAHVQIALDFVRLLENRKLPKLKGRPARLCVQPSTLPGNP